MPKEEWGVKRNCPTTGKRFYDLSRSPVVSPYTGEVVDIDLPGRKGGPLQPEVEKVKPVKKAPDDEESDVLIDDDDVAVEDEALLDDEDDDTVSFDELSDVADDDED